MNHIDNITLGLISADTLFRTLYRWQAFTDELFDVEFNGEPLVNKLLPDLKTFVGDNASFSIVQPNKAVSDLLFRFGKDCLKKTFTAKPDCVERDIEKGVVWKKTDECGCVINCTLLPITADDIELVLHLLHGNETTKNEYDTLLSFYLKLVSEEVCAKIKNESEKVNGSLEGAYIFPVIIFYN